MRRGKALSGRLDEPLVFQLTQQHVDRAATQLLRVALDDVEPVGGPKRLQILQDEAPVPAEQQELEHRQRE